MAVVLYPNPTIPRASQAEFEGIAQEFRNHGLDHVADLVVTLFLIECQHLASFSFNLSLRPRDSDGKPSEDPLLFFRQQDMLIGTRSGRSSGFMWFKDFATRLANQVPEGLCVFNEICQEAVDIANTGSRQSLQEAIQGEEATPPQRN